MHLRRSPCMIGRSLCPGEAKQPQRRLKGRPARPGRARTREPGFLGVKSIGKHSTTTRQQQQQQAGRQAPARGSPLYYR